jgi:diguanylate cyclase (GGDEF)-like protein
MSFTTETPLPAAAAVVADLAAAAVVADAPAAAVPVDLAALPAAVAAQLLPALLADQGAMLAVKALPSGRYLHVNTAMAAFLGRPAAQVLGHTDADLLDAALATTWRAAEATAQAQSEPLRSEHRFDWRGERQVFSVLRVASPAGATGPETRWLASEPETRWIASEPETRWIASVWTNAAPQAKHEAQLATALAQIAEQQLANDALRRELADQALRDPASGLYRRGHFEDQLRREVDLSTREHREFAIVFIDIDPLPAKVQALGDAGLQRVLEAMGRLLRGGTRAMDASCRFSERRFAVLLSGVGLATAHARMEGLRRKCAAQIVVHDGQELGFTVAVGVASFPHTAQTQDALTEACETALAEAQRRGGNHVALAAIRFSLA